MTVSAEIIFYKYWFVGCSAGFYGISNIVGYLMPNRLYTCVLDIYGLVWFYGILTIVAYLIPTALYSYKLNIYDLVGLGFMAYQHL